MRLGFVSRYPPVHCGIGEYTRLLAEALLSSEPSLRIWVFSTREAGLEPYRVDGVVVVPSYDRGSGFHGILDRLAEIGGVDVLHLQHEFGIYGDGWEIIDVMIEARAEKLARVVVATLHTVYHPFGLEESHRSRFGLFNEAKRLDSVIVHSVVQEFELVSQGYSYARLHRIPHGTSINVYVNTPRSELLARLGLEQSLASKRILAVPGFLRPDKGLTTMLEALSRIKRSDVSLIVAGEPQGKKGEETMKIVEEYAARDERLVFIRRYLTGDEVLMLSALADVIVLPYRDRPGKYSVSGILHLSMGSLKPIIGTRVPRLVELYQLAPRMVVSPGSAAELAEKIEWVLRNYDQVIAYMGPLFSYAVRTMWGRMARRHLLLYQRLLQTA